MAAHKQEKGLLKELIEMNRESFIEYRNITEYWKALGEKKKVGFFI